MASDMTGITQNHIEDFLQTLSHGMELTRQLAAENEQLRTSIKELEGVARKKKETSPIISEHDLLSVRIDELEREKEELAARVQQLEEENEAFASRSLEIEAENNNLANLYVASYQLHSTLESAEVMQIITEILINLVGGEEFAIMLLDERLNELRAIATEGIPIEEIHPVKLGQGIIGNVAKSGENYCFEDGAGYESSLDNPLVCIPLLIKERVIGVIVIYKLLMQKTTFADLDYELFSLLAGQAATAIFSSKLYSESERKLSTIQGFIELLSK